MFILTNKFIFAPPRQGKTFIATKEAVDALDHNRLVLSNYPIVLPGGKCSRVWKSAYIYENIQNALIVIDEAQEDYDSQEHKQLSADEDLFFATSGHNGNEIRIISQNPTRVAKAVRDRMNEWVRVRVWLDIPFLRNKEGKLGKPLLFVAVTWLTIEDMNSQSKERVYLREFHWYNRRVADAYNTHYFRKPGEPFLPPLWSEEIRRRALERTASGPDPAGSPGISAVADGYRGPQAPKNPFSYAYLSAKGVYANGKNKIKAFSGYLSSVLSRFAILLCSYGGRAGKRFAFGALLRKKTTRYPYDAEVLAEYHGGKKPESAGCNHVQKLLPGNDPTEKTAPVFQKSGLDMAGVANGLEKDLPQTHQVES